MSITSELAGIVHRIIDGLGPLANKDALHADLDAAVTAAETEAAGQAEPPASSQSSEPSAPSEPDTPAVHPAAPVVPPFGTEDSPHAPL